MKVWRSWPGEHSASIWVFTTAKPPRPFEEIRQAWSACVKRHLKRECDPLVYVRNLRGNVASLYVNFSDNVECWKDAHRILPCLERRMPEIGYIGWKYSWFTRLVLRGPWVLYVDGVVRGVFKDLFRIWPWEERE